MKYLVLLVLLFKSLSLFAGETSFEKYMRAYNEDLAAQDAYERTPRTKPGTQVRPNLALDNYNKAGANLNAAQGIDVMTLIEPSNGHKISYLRGFNEEGIYGEGRYDQTTKKWLENTWNRGGYNYDCGKLLYKLGLN